MAEISKAKEKKKQVKKYIQLGLGAALVLLLAVMPMLASSRDAGSGTQASILTATVETKTIDIRIIGGGQLSSEESLNVRIPEQVKLTEYLVGNGDTVKEGDAIAKVDRVSVMTAIAEVQETLDYLAEEIADAADEEASTKVKALAGGTVKVIYAREGEAVQDVMLRAGALATLSLDDTMAVEIAADTALDVGDAVCVTLSGGGEVRGRVKTNLEGVLTVTIADDDYPVGEKVTVSREDGTVLGSGLLYVASPWNVIAYSGTVEDILVKENASVNTNQNLFSLTDTGHTARFQQLIDQRQEYEELMQELFVMYRTQTVTASCDGIVTGVDEDGAYLLSGQEENLMLSLLSFFRDEQSGFVAHPVTVTEVTEDGLTMELDPDGICVEDPAMLSRVSADLGDMTETWHYSGDPVVHTQDENGLLQEAGTARAGDILLAVGDSEQVYWFVALNGSTWAAGNQENFEVKRTGNASDTVGNVSILTSELNQGVVGENYSSFLQATDGTTVLTGTWAAVGLPDGLSMDASTGVISGIPSAAGSYYVTVSFTCDGVPVVKAYTLTVVEASQETQRYLGYVARVTEVGNGAMKVMQTAYSYTITDLNQLPQVSVDAAALTQEATYASSLISEAAVAVNDDLLIVVDEDGSLVHFVKLDSSGGGQTDTPGEGTGSISGSGGMPSGMTSAGGMTMGGMGQEQTSDIYPLDKLTIASVTSQEHMTVEITVDEMDIARLHTGQRAVVSVDALGGEQFDATITKIANSGENSGGNSKFTVEVTLDRSGEMLPGMHASVTITLQSNENVPCVPVAALYKAGADSVLYTAYDADSGALGDPVVVTIGCSDGEYVEILSDLEPGMTCHYEYYDTYVGSDEPDQGGFSMNRMGR